MNDPLLHTRATYSQRLQRRPRWQPTALCRPPLEEVLRHAIPRLPSPRRFREVRRDHTIVLTLHTYVMPPRDRRESGPVPPEVRAAVVAQPAVP